MECRIHFDTNHLWIGSLQVSTSFRSRGLGRQLVDAAEEIACEMGVRTVSVLPLLSAQGFWSRMGYRAHPGMARVLSKELASSEFCHFAHAVAP